MDKHNIIVSINNFAYLMNLNYDKKIKHKLFWLWLRINFKYLTRLGKTKEKILNYKITTYDYHMIRSAFDELYVKGVYDFKCNTAKPIILDCGANIGLASIFFKWRYPECTVYAFEPDTDTCKMYLENMRQNNFNNIFLFPFALSGKDEITTFYTTNVKGDMKSSLYKDKDNTIPKEVKCIKLSEWIYKHKINKLDLIKLDIEGAETAVLNDLEANNMIRIADKYIIEYHHQLGEQKSTLGKFLKLFEVNGFSYQLDCFNFPLNKEGNRQGIMIYAYKNVLNDYK